MHTKSANEFMNFSFLRGVFENPAPSTDSIDYSFLRTEIAKRRVPPEPVRRGIELPEPQTKAPTRSPKFFAGRPVIREAQFSFGDLPFDSVPERVPVPYISGRRRSPPRDDKQARARKPVNYVSWKYLGDTDGVFGCLTGKLDADQDPEVLRRKLSNMPYAMKKYKVTIDEPSETKSTVKARDLYALSIKSGVREEARQRARSRISEAEARADPYTRLFIQTDRKLIPLTASRLRR